MALSHKKKTLWLHLPLLALWLAAFILAARQLFAERHYYAARACTDIPEKHVAELEDAVRLNPYHGEAHALLGRVRYARAGGKMKSGKFDAGREEYEASIEHTETALRCQMDLENALQLASAHYKLATDCKEISERHPEDHPGRKEWGAAADKHYIKAELRLLEILAYVPDQQIALYHLAKLSLDLKRFNRAFELATRCLRLHPATPEICYIVGKSLDEMGELDGYRMSLHEKHRFLILGIGEVLPDSIRNFDWDAYLRPWIDLFRLVELGEIIPGAGVELD